MKKFYLKLLSVFIVSFFALLGKTFAATSCSYTLYGDAFSTDSNRKSGYNSNIEYRAYIQTKYYGLNGLGLTEYLARKTEIALIFYSLQNGNADDELSIINRVKFTFSLDGANFSYKDEKPTIIVDYNYKSGSKTKNKVDNLSITKNYVNDDIGFKEGQCPDVVSIDFKNKNINNQWIVKAFYFEDYNNSIEQIVKSADRQYSGPLDNRLNLIFYSQTSNSQGLNAFDAVNGSMCLNDFYYEDSSYLRYNSIASETIKKYLNGKDMVELLNYLKNSLSSYDSGSTKDLSDALNNSKNGEVWTDYLVDNGLVDEISNDLKILTSIKNNQNIRGCFKDSNLTVEYSEWFEKYAKDEPLQYLDVLYYLLQTTDSYVFRGTLEKKEFLTNLSHEKYCEQYAESYCNLNTTSSSEYEDCLDNELNHCDKIIEDNWNDFCAQHMVYGEDGINEYCEFHSCGSDACDYMTTNECIEAELKNYVCPINYSPEAVAELEGRVDDELKNVDNTINKTFSKLLTDTFEQTGIDLGDNDLCKLLGDPKDENSLYYYIILILDIIKIGGPVLVILLTGYDGIKMIASSKEEENKKFLNHFKIRLICIVLLLLTPTIMEFLISLLHKYTCNI